MSQKTLLEFKITYTDDETVAVSGAGLEKLDMFVEPFWTGHGCPIAKWDKEKKYWEICPEPTPSKFTAEYIQLWFEDLIKSLQN